MNLRRARMNDAELLFAWANDPVTRQNSFSREPIAWENHMSWFEKKLADQNCLFLILEDKIDNERVACGSIRYDLRSEKEALISYQIAPEQRGKGYGEAMIRLGEAEVKSVFGDIKLIAEVRLENEASKKCFEKNGYAVAEVNEREVIYENPYTE